MGPAKTCGELQFAALAHRSADSRDTHQEWAGSPSALVLLAGVIATAVSVLLLVPSSGGFTALDLARVVAMLALVPALLIEFVLVVAHVAGAAHRLGLRSTTAADAVVLAGVVMLVTCLALGWYWILEQLSTGLTP